MQVELSTLPGEIRIASKNQGARVERKPHRSPVVESEVESSMLDSNRHIIPSDPDGPLVETDEFLEELESYQEQFEDEPFKAVQSGKYISGNDPLESSLVEVLVRYTSLSMVQLEDAARFAITQLSLQFEQILTGNDLEGDIRTLLGYLQVPLLKLAIQDTSFINETNNAAIRLFYKLSDIAALWSPQANVHTDKLYKLLAGKVEEVREADPLSYKLCEKLLDELIATDLSGFQIEAVKVSEPDPAAEDVVDELVSEIEDHIENEAEAVTTEEVVAADFDEIDAEFEQLIGESEESSSEPVETAMPQETLSEQEDIPEVTEVASPPVQESAVDPVVDEKADEEKLRALVNAITVGVRIDYDKGEGAERLRVAALLPSSGEIVLVNRNQEKVGSFDKEDIFEELRDGTMKLVEDTLSFDRTLESVIGSMRK